MDVFVHIEFLFDDFCLMTTSFFYGSEDGPRPYPFKNILIFRGLFGIKRVKFELCYSSLEQSMKLVLYQ